MAKDTEPLETLNANARAVKQAEQVVEKTIDQTRGALDNYFSFMQKAFPFYPVGGTELAEKMSGYTAQNISAARDFVHKLSQAKDFQDIIRIQTEFMQTQFSVFTEQTKSLTEAFTKAATSR
jgi:phasin protein